MTKIVHKMKNQVPVCRGFKLGEALAGHWSKVNCRQCLEIKKTSLGKRWARYYQRQEQLADENDEKF